MKCVSSRRRSQTGFRPSFELLETRLTPSTFTVANLNDSGMGSLRQAIMDANGNSGADVIDFSVAGTIQLTSAALPAVTDQVTINGTSAPNFGSAPLVEIDNNGFAGLTIDAPNSSLAGLSIVNANGAGVTLDGNSVTVVGNYIGLALDGSVAGNTGNGIVVSSSGATIGGTAAGAGNVISGNSLNGILVENPTTGGTVIQGNFIGTNVAGSAALGNLLSGVLLQTSGGATIGGSTPGAGNVISGNKSDGVEINGLLTSPELSLPSNGGKGSLLAGTYFYVVTATTTQGETTASNEQTITLTGPGAVDLTWTAVGGASSYKIYRGTGVGEENVLVATVFSPATILHDAGAATTPGKPPLNNTAVVTGLAPSIVQGNEIGTDVSGTLALGNVFDGIHIDQVSGTTIGGTTSGARNLISGNGGFPDSGIGIDLIGASTSGTVIQGNFIGTDISGGVRLGNNSNGIFLQGAVNTLIGGTSAGAGNVISGNAFIDSGEAGISLISSSNTNTIEDNLIGTDVTGKVNLGNGGAGISIDTGSSNNTIGGTTTGQRNVISGNGFGLFGPDAGIEIGDFTNLNANQDAENNVVEGNFVGVDVTGGTALGNSLAGVAILAGSGSNTIGGTAAGAGNVLSGNSGEVGSGAFGDGVIISNSSRNSVLGNRIGVDVSGLVALPNAGDGLYLFQGGAGNIIGAPGAGNIISGNSLSGIFFQDFSSGGNSVQGNAIGVDATRTVAIPNQRYGLEIASSAFNQIGGTVAGAGNVISGNLAGGLSITSLLSPPLLRTPTLGLGGSLPAGAYYYVVTATTDPGASETTASAERTITLTTPGAVVLKWVAVEDVTGYKVYRGTAPGAENVLVATVAGANVTSFTDAGGATTPGSPPQTNTAIGDGNSNSVLGNTIGLNGAGTAAVPNSIGVLIVQDVNTSIGGTQPGDSNIISGNLSDGIRISGSESSSNEVQGNFIGTASDGHTPFPNGGNGVALESGASGNGTFSNIIQNNAQDGVLVQTGSNRNSIIENSIFNNGNFGIELQPGANQSLPAPVITSAFVVQGNTLVQGTVTGPANAFLMVEFFASPSAPTTGPGQGQTFLKEFGITTGPTGQSTFSATISGSASAGQFLTATARDSQENTSEFSAGTVIVNNPLASLTIAMYQDVLQRSPSVSDINYWEAQLGSGVSRSVMAQAVWESAEHRTIEVDHYYLQYFVRAPDPGAETYWVSQMLAGLSETAIQIEFLVSAENTLARPAISDYVTELYNAVLNRVPIPAEVQIWVDAAALGATRAQLAFAFLTSQEANTNSLNTYYSEFLNRKPDPAGEAYFLNALATGLATPQSVAESILASDEFFALASGS